MSKIALEGNASGTGTLTIASQNTNSNFTLTLPNSSGTVVVTGGAQTIEFAAGTVSAPSITTTGDTNTGIFFPAADTIAFTEGGAEAMRIDSSGNVLVGITTPYSGTSSNFTASTGIDVGSSSTATSKSLQFIRSATTGTVGSIVGSTAGFTNYSSIDLVIDNVGGGSQAGSLRFNTTSSATTAERARITSGGDFLVGKTVTTLSTAGVAIFSTGAASLTCSADEVLNVNRLTNDGSLVRFFQDTVEEGNISVSGSTVSYNGGNLSRWAQLTTPKDDTPLFKGTVMSNLDEMNVYIKPTLYWTEDDELPVDEEGNPTVAVGDVKQETSVSENEQLNKVKVSDVEGDVNVAGVFVNWSYDEAHQVDEINMAMTGDMIIRIAQGVVVQKGDLLMSAGDGTAKPQGDDIVRSKTVAKVTSNHVTCTYDDGSYCVPCVLMAC